MSFGLEVGVRESTHVLFVIFMSFLVVFMLFVVLMTLFVIIVEHGTRRYFIVLGVKATETVVDVEATDVALQSSIEALSFVTSLLFSRQVGDSLLNVSSRDRIIDNIYDATARSITVQ